MSVNNGAEAESSDTCIGPPPALQVPDIVDQILLRLVKGVDTKRTDLLSMACCCKAFEAPSLDVLWRNMETVIPLLQLLPETEEIQGSLVITGKLVLEDLPPRFRNYAMRIQKLVYKVTGSFAEVHPSTWIRLAQLNGALLPNLQSFTLSYPDSPTSRGRERSLQLIPAFARSHSLKTFRSEISRVDDRHDVGHMLSILADCNLGISTIAMSGTFVAWNTNLLASMRTLRSVTLQLSPDSILSDVMTALATLPQLVTLGMEFFGAIPNPPHTGLRLSPSLTEIKLKGVTIFISHTLMSIKPSGLQRLDAEIAPGATASTDISFTQGFILLYLQPSRFTALKHVFMDMKGCVPPLSPFARENKFNFVTLLLRHHIETLVLESLHPTTCFSDGDIAELAAAWPRLKTLRLEHTALPVVRPSFASLDHLARGCSQLKDVAITLQGDAVPDRDYYITGVSSQGLWSLDLQHTDIKRYPRAARYIDGLFPFLENFSMCDPTDCEAMRDTIFNACQLVRKDQIRRERAKRIIS